MNQRIRELAEQSGLKIESWMTNPPKPFQILGSTEDFEKFAELIVKECCEQLVKQGNAWEQFSQAPPPGQENNAGPALFAAYRLKEDAVWELEEHFGVNNE